MGTEVGRAYSLRAEEYTSLFGSIDAAHPADRELVKAWGSRLTGKVLDAGCGPGHWTKYLSDLGLSISGVDQVPQFIERARQAYPEVEFQLGNIDFLDCADGSYGGALAWYSLIHHRPESLQVPLSELSRTIRANGELLIGFFDGDGVQKFDHAVVPAYRWSVAALSEQLNLAGFDVLETHRRTGEGQRPHGAILARRRTTSPTSGLLRPDRLPEPSDDVYRRVEVVIEEPTDQPSFISHIRVTSVLSN